MITMTTDISGMHGTRLRLVPAVSTYVVSTSACVWKQRPSVLALGAFGIDNSTGVSAVECRHR